MSPHGLMFHHVHGGLHPQVQGSLSQDDLRRIIKAHPRLIPAREFLAKHEVGALERDECVLTFDDGLRCQYDLAKPVVEEFGLTAFWFVPTAPLIGVVSRLEVYRWLRTVAFGSVEMFYRAWDYNLTRHEGHASTCHAPADYLADHAYLSREDRDFRYWRDQMATPQAYERVMDTMLEHRPPRDGIPRCDTSTLSLTRGHVLQLHHDGHVVGTHSHAHPTTLAKLTKEQQEIEYATSTYILAEILGERPRAMSHPCNQYTSHGLRYLKGLGYTVGFRAIPDPDGIAEGLPLLVPRVNSADLR